METKSASGKKRYSKPTAVLVDFTLSSSIAAGCKYEAVFDSEQSCGFWYNGWIAFNLSPGGSVCNFQMEPPAHFCYHVPTEERAIFNS